MIHFFTDPVLRAPTLGCMLMCLTCAIVGVIVFVRKESLLGETLAHATYPGIMVGALLVALSSLQSFLIWGLLGAAVTCVLSLLLLNFVKKKLSLKNDSALCFTLTLFFGIGLTLSSYLQTSNSGVYKQARIFLFGQAVTITDQYLYVYFIFASIVVLTVLLFYRQMQIANFDPIFAKTVGIPPKLVVGVCYLLLIASITIGIRSIGLFLLSGMLIGPAISARQWTDRLSRMLILAALIGLSCGFLGVVICEGVAQKSGYVHSLATGPTILLVSAIVSVFSLLFAPKRGWIFRYLRIMKFKKQCSEENILKSLWHISHKMPNGVSWEEIYAFQSLSKVYFMALLVLLDLKGSLIRINSLYYLTPKGKEKAEHIVRMHRLWELYLVHIGVGLEKVHHNAEEMEHIITPQIEKELLKLMKNPTTDPHNQPIPAGEYSMLGLLNPYSGASGGQFFSIFFSRLLKLITSQELLVSDELQILTLTLISVSAALVGVFLIYRKMTMLANALSHSILFGIAVTFLFARALHVSFSLSLSFEVMFIAALITGFITAFFSELIVKVSRLQKDAAIGLVFTTLFAAGIVLISLFSRNSHIGTELVLGNVDALHSKDLSNAFKMLLVSLSLVSVFFGGLKLTSFDPVYAKLRGLSSSFYNYLMIFLLSMTSIASFRAVGVVLVLSFFTVPPLLAKMFAKSLSSQIGISMLIGTLSSFFGVLVSRHLLTQYGLALSTGGVTVLVLYSLFFTLWGYSQVCAQLKRWNLLKKWTPKASDKRGEKQARLN